MLVVVGLGNPGRAYEHSRHNVGYHVVDELARRRGFRFREGNGSFLHSHEGGSLQDLLLVKPLTFMNDSGVAVAECLQQFDLPASDLLIVFDDLQIPLGSIRLRSQGSDGGHNGMGSIIERLQTESIPRMRCGIGAPEATESAEWKSFVLDTFAPEETTVVRTMVATAADAAVVALEKGFTVAMNTFNRTSSS